MQHNNRSNKAKPPCDYLNRSRKQHTAKFSSHSGTTTRQAREQGSFLSLAKVCVRKTCSQLSTGRAECSPWAPSGQLLTILPCSSPGTGAPAINGDQENRKAAIKLAPPQMTWWCRKPWGPSENSLIRKSTISRGKDVWMYEASLALLYVFKMEKPIKKNLLWVELCLPQNKFTKKCWSPNPQNVWTCPHLEKCLCRCIYGDVLKSSDLHP